MYRIKSTTFADGKSSHLVQEKFLNLFWASVCDSYSECTLSFSTIEEAKAAIDKFIAADLGRKATSTTYTNYP